MFLQKMRYMSILVLFICLTIDLKADSLPYSWTQLFPSSSPTPRHDASMAFDPADGQLILFGGIDSSNTLLNDTWNWNGITWQQLSPATSPSPRSGVSMAFDPATGQLILFGGINSSGGLLNDTWNWNGTNWIQLSPSSSPSARQNASMAFDPATGQLILFGGVNSSGDLLNDTWNWDGSNWHQLAPITSPPARIAASMAFDPSTGQLILFGGVGSNGLLNDTWNWDGTNWNNLSPAVSSSPPVRVDASMAFDPATGQLILFGGTGSGEFMNDTWTWDGTQNTWIQLFPPISPPPRSGASMDFDPVTGQLILFGGTNSIAGESLNDTWNWGIICSEDVTWTQLIPANAPSARLSASMAFDPATGQLILFGGASSTSELLNDTWNWDGINWQQLSPEISPSPRSGAPMAFDLATGQLILFGGTGSVESLNDTWNWNGTNWQQLSPATSPLISFGASMAFDPATGQLILFGGIRSGESLNDTWTWDGFNWTQLFPTTSPPPRSEASMAFDPVNGQLILFGGKNSATPSVVFNDTWRWDGSNWTQLSPATSPSARYGASMAFDPATGQLILFGGIDNNDTILNDTWNWNGTTWTQLLPTTSPPDRLLASMEFDPATGQLILFGGLNGSGFLNDTWNWGIAIPTAIATPSSESICSGETTSFTLSSNVVDTTFSWTVVEDGVTGASNDSGSLIAQVLTGTGKATYTITPTAPNGCLGLPLTVLVIVQPCPGPIQPVEGPTHFRGKIKCKQCASHTKLIHILSWKASPDPNVIGYKVFQGQKLIATINGANVNKLKIPHRKNNKRYHYSIVAFTASGEESQPVKRALQGLCISCDKSSSSAKCVVNKNTCVVNKNKCVVNKNKCVVNKNKCVVNKKLILKKLFKDSNMQFLLRTKSGIWTESNASRLDFRQHSHIC